MADFYVRQMVIKDLVHLERLLVELTADKQHHLPRALTLLDSAKKVVGPGKACSLYYGGYTVATTPFGRNEDDSKDHAGSFVKAFLESV